MKKIILILLLSFCFIFAKEQKLLDIKPAQNFYPKLNTKECNINCLFDLLESRLYLSFLSEFTEQNNQFLSNIYIKLLNSITDFEKNIQKITSVKLAIIIPEKTIKSYSNTIINSSIAYLLRQKAEIKVKVFLIGTENSTLIQSALEQAQNQGYKYAIAGFTLKGVNELKNYSGNMKIFIPTIHKNNTSISNENIIFGSIDYDAQIARLLNQANDNIAIFGDGSTLSNNLNARVLSQSTQAKIYTLEGEKFDFNKLLKSQGGLNNTSIFFNTPLIKTALISSQLRIYDIYPYVLLSTQINYNPTFLSLTQEGDRNNFILANSIYNHDDNLSYLNEIFNQNINYNWIAYASSIGVDYFYTEFLNKKSDSLFDEKIKNSQVEYKVRLMRGKQASFEELK
ncbi:hypothetical protein N4T57_04215 [Campylobacter hepaticus]|uniref:hypothetical protein n=1 Tax=Campylobacter hepaticus TaxID=1813019 RepID=UPI00082792D2|nr:hypothetical protein [Campylobacter hepaticus]MCZ0772358.1 hypothetical protein [Campylobacter hepaticus]MCZ0773826.1 hypothetical protein [Campylobacter hepaticus]MCZ0775077.1 hypothetical protein [Campylobacter hepaticus]MDX2322946.1 hypothetical protein [Campylobacter hepaticus]MDX2332046.1 hypothetical protein [Campylobacter hepaticus]